MESYKILDRCLTCDSTNLHKYLDLGTQPLANDYPAAPCVQEEFPLAVNLCKTCFHSQLTVAVAPDLMFKNYRYMTSATGKTSADYFTWFVENAEKLKPNKKLKALDIASNDGHLLSFFKAKNHEVLGVDPAENLAAKANAEGIKTLCKYWTEEIAAQIDETFDIISAMNVFAHNSDPYGFLLACKKVMDDDSLLFIQTSQAEIFKNSEFDTVYHEHLSFFTAKSFKTLFERVGLVIDYVEKVSIHGKSYLFRLKKAKTNAAHDASYVALYEQEKSWGFYDLAKYDSFAEKFSETAKQVNEICDEYAAKGYEIVAYGAAAKSMTFINYAKPKIDYYIDETPLKMGRYTPGLNIPIHAPDELLKTDTKKLIIITAWNFAEEIANKAHKFMKNSKAEFKFATYFPKIKLWD